jgi:uncharacterized protein
VEQRGQAQIEFSITDHPERRRWEVTSGDAVVAFAEYRLAPGRVTFTHTVVEPEYEGHGLGSRLARHVLDDAVARGLRISPRCPFIRSYVERHREYMPSIDMPEPRP